MNATTSILVREWEDKPDEGRTADDWPYPTQHRKFAIGGALADRVRARFGVEDEHQQVFIVEHEMSGGWSEYTQETDYEFDVECGSHRVEFHSAIWSEGASTGVAELQKWLDK